MRVLYFIFVSAGGRGGHFHSLHHITQVLGNTEHCNIDIITIGDEVSEVLKKNPFFKRHLFFNRKNYLNFYKQLYTEINKSKADILHFFDAHSFNIYYPLFFFLRAKVVVNKCGGPNPIYYPIVPNLILFSQENKRWFESRKQFNNTLIEVIPNRVSTVKVELKDDHRKSDDYFNIVRICRIGSTYYNSILNGINLIKDLSDKNQARVKLYIIGKVTEQKEFLKLRELSTGYNIEFIINDEYTSEASKMLYLADVVIGTGRSAMEALSLSIPVLVPSMQSKYPILLNTNNYKDFIDKNFTERVKLERVSDDIVYNDIVKLIDSENFYNSASDFSKKIFDEYFNVDEVRTRYFEFYKKAIKNKYSKVSGVFVNVKRLLSTTYRMFNNNF